MNSAQHTIDWFIVTLSSGLGLIGRLMFLSQENRRTLNWSLLWEVPIAIGMGLFGRGLGEKIGADGIWLWCFSIACGFLGPRILSQLANTITKWPSLK